MTLQARVKVRDIYKMACILPTWEIKCLAKSGFRHGLPTGGCVALFPVCCTKKRVHEPYTTAATGKQWQQKFASGIHKLRDIWLNPFACWNCLCLVSSQTAFKAIVAERRHKKVLLNNVNPSEKSCGAKRFQKSLLSSGGETICCWPSRRDIVTQFEVQ